MSAARQVYACGNDRWAVFAKDGALHGVCIPGGENKGLEFVTPSRADLLLSMQRASSELTLFGLELRPIREVRVHPYLIEAVKAETRGTHRRMVSCVGVVQ